MADLCDKVLNEAGEDNAAVFEIRQMMPEDEEYPDAALDDQPAILVADDRTPSETVQLNKSKLLGFITRYGPSNSHTVIPASTMNIPALIGMDFDDSWDGKLAVLDGYNHCVYIDPAQELLTAMEKKRKGNLKQEALLQGLKRN